MTTVDRIRESLDKIWNSFAKSIAVLVASIYMVFSLGMLFGYFVAVHPIMPLWVMMIPPMLGVLAFYYRTLSVAGFLIFLVLVFIF